MVADQTGLDDRDDVGVHKRLAAGQPDLAGRRGPGGDLVEKADYLRERDISQPVVLGARFDIAVPAGQVAQRAGVEP